MRTKLRNILFLSGAFFLPVVKIFDKLYHENYSMLPLAKNEPSSYRIFVAGGCAYRKEKGVHRTCELLQISDDGREVFSTPFPALTTGRRGAACVFIPSPNFSSANESRDSASAAENKTLGAIFIFGGCAEHSAETDEERLHLNCGEYFILPPNFGDNIFDGNYFWRPAASSPLLNIGRSCFMHVERFASADSSSAEEEEEGENCVYVLGGWNGRECLSNMERIRFKDIFSTPPDAQIKKREPANTKRKNIFTTKTEYARDDLISPIKNGCALRSKIEGEEKKENHIFSILLVGGWDGKRTLNTIFRYSFFTNDGHSATYIQTAAASSSISTGSKNTLQLQRLLPYGVECHACVLYEKREQEELHREKRKNQTIFITGGFDGFGVKKGIIRYDLTDDSITILPVGLRTARECHCAQILDEFLVIFGGWNGYEALRSVEIFKIIPEYPYLKEWAYHENALSVPRNRACSAILQQ